MRGNEQQNRKKDRGRVRKREGAMRDEKKRDRGSSYTNAQRPTERSHE